MGTVPCMQAYLAGLTFALAASPCSTPVLATLLAYVASSQDPLLGGGLLLAYTSGCTPPGPCSLQHAAHADIKAAYRKRASSCDLDR